jgi:imidazolonepropionase-like amidohydrolase
MRKLLTIFLFLFFIRTASSQSMPVDSAVYLLHKWEQPIGQEKYKVFKKNGITIYMVDFKYIDRGSPVHLKDSLVFTTAMEPLLYRIKGGTSRFSTVSDSVDFHNQRAFSFPIAGYSPATAQMLLVRYWNKHNRPKTIYTPPSGSVEISKAGEDTILFRTKPEVFIRYIIKGLIWGNELVWTNTKGELVCLITNDAEGDKQEMMLEAYESLLPGFIDKSALYGMKLFAKEATATMQVNKLIAIRGGTLIDVVNNKTLPDITILIENGAIKAVGKAGDVRIPGNAFIIDGKGKTILPGLWDMHAHFEQAEWGPAYLAAGVTTVRDCGNEFGYINTTKRTIDNGIGIGPDILKAGIIDGKGPFSLGIIQADTREEAVAAVKRYQENGFVQIKIYGSVKPEILSIICREAHHLGMTVTGHIPNGMNLMQAVDSGMDMVNHAQYILTVLKLSKSDSSIDFSKPENKAVMDFIKKHHVVIDPTLGVFELAFRSVKDSITLMEPNFASLPEPLKALFINTGFSDEKGIEWGKRSLRYYKQIVGELYKDSIVIVAGTDMGFPGYSVFRELELYVESGLSPMAALKTATIVPATVMNMDTKTGSIEPGKGADIILVDGNPLEDISNIRKVNLVIRNGIVYSPAVLHHMAGFQ